MPMKTLQSDNGFTLIEVLIAMVVLSIGILSLFSMQINSIKGNSKASHITTASIWNVDQVERMVGMQYTDATLADTDGDGTDVDSDGNGVDDNVANFGLDDITALTADVGPIITADGRYTLYLNIAIDVPMENLKTIRVHVQDNRQVLSRPVTFTYIKADII
jgi:prepilin-type N-terminal cleavage/methylation domain-containing protein